MRNRAPKHEATAFDAIEKTCWDDRAVMGKCDLLLNYLKSIIHLFNSKQTVTARRYCFKHICYLLYMFNSEIIFGYNLKTKVKISRTIRQAQSDKRFLLILTFETCGSKVFCSDNSRGNVSEGLLRNRPVTVTNVTIAVGCRQKKRTARVEWWGQQSSVGIGRPGVLMPPSFLDFF